MDKTETETNAGLPRGINKRTARAFAVGTSVGRGSLVVTGNTYLRSAGLAGNLQIGL